MKRLILLSGILFFINGCLYINQDVGLTTYQYDKCVEYYDENGNYYKDCPDSIIKKSADTVVDTTKSVVYKTKEFMEDLGASLSKKKCICKKSCMKSCTLTKRECLKKCCHEEK